MADILIADDSDAIRLVLKDILSIGEHDVVAEAIDGEEAVSLYQKHNPQILLLDLAMPKKDGFVVVKEIIKYDPKAKIILITASDDQKIINQCLDNGATTYISKPFDFNSVLKSISDILVQSS
ncbi:putative chemotaxis protein Chey [Candidatus Nitrosopumilus salaria BD31]|uniref:Chemotaxis protein Chey n=1 Tax=Candidatus Nitrosopumilus salarius BD31 TaxID=859350 RepID=I3D2L9_9ARCH|nr:response regulator [Candidatus Nitrosopumilus salaria]EIJ65962.1 putative chemotaxis protein Chey [Candidatus Nitrosopumilus salaria BD31]